MKILGIVLLVGVLVVGYILLTSEKPDQNLPAADVAESTVSENVAEGAVDDKQMEENLSVISNLDFSFVGFGPGKSHPGTFEDIKIENLSYDENGLNSGTATIMVESVKTDNKTLDGHLCGENFFDCENHKEIVFNVTGSEGATVTGDLTFKGITKSVSFDLTASENGSSYETDFRLNVKEFGFEGPTVNEEVQIKFTATK